MKSFATFAPLLLVAQTFAKQYSQTDSIIGSGFLSAFSHQAIADPTHGRVNYVSQSTAQAQNLTFASSDHFIIRADHTTKLSASGPGRNSVRLQSNKQFTNHVAVFNVRHMPQGCGTWPAIWEVGDNWPNNGEIDIVEGVNDVSPNQATLHTNAGCTMPGSRTMTGTATGNNCDVAATGNSGCGVKSSQTNSYGPAFNSAGGGWFAVERTPSFIRVWFWTRNASNVPADVKNGVANINTDNWPIPMALFPNNSCDINSHFGPQRIIINLTFCGDWAGAVYSSQGCPGSCVDFVNNNPSAFNDAYFDFASLRVYQ
ncbi:laminarinase [Cristinia sonorae]|uniref:Laminarinase n=1 Tax=Cristinia sonorae TaxID=1940300 RepID=A0A8K0UWM6_9AGAR|nr:laminarinase [Cristinia sonorae]